MDDEWCEDIDKLEVRYIFEKRFTTFKKSKLNLQEDEFTKRNGILTIDFC